MIRCNEVVLCYLTEQAQVAMDQLVSIGLDPDLALVVLEQTWPECDVYEIESKDGASSGPAAR